MQLARDELMMLLTSLSNKSKDLEINSTFFNQLTQCWYGGNNRLRLVSGEKVDNSKTFDVFYGKLKSIPLVSECALSIECKVTDILNRGGVDDIIMGEIIETYCNEDCITDGNPDIKKMGLPVFSMFENKYFKIGEYIGWMGYWQKINQGGLIECYIEDLVKLKKLFLYLDTDACGLRSSIMILPRLLKMKQ